MVVEKNNEGGGGEKHIVFYLISLLTLMVRVGEIYHVLPNMWEWGKK